MPGETRKKILPPPGDEENESHYYTLLQKKEYSSKNATATTFLQTLVSVIGYIRTQDSDFANSGLLPCSRKKNITFSLKGV